VTVSALECGHGWTRLASAWWLAARWTQRGHAGPAVVPWCQPSITTYACATVWVLQSVATAEYRHCQRHGGSRLACASPCRPRGTQRSRAGSPACTRALRASGRATGTTAYRCATAWVVSQLARRGTATPKPLATARCRIVLAHPNPTPVHHLQRRQNYITPHCPQCPPVSR